MTDVRLPGQFIPEIPDRLVNEVTRRVAEALRIYTPAGHADGQTLTYMRGDQKTGVYMQSAYLSEIVGAALIATVHPDHLYWSTACIHGDDGYCAADVSALTGKDKKPHTCKFCESSCVCGCHESP